MAGFTIPTLPLRIAQRVASSVQDAVAERTAPPVVTAVRRDRLTRLPSRALAEIHERVIAAERVGIEGLIVIVADGGAAIVAADGRSSAREVCVHGIADPGPLAASLTRYGFRPEVTRVTLHSGAPAASGDPVAVGYTADAGTVAVLAGRLVRGGVLVVTSGEAAVDALRQQDDVRISARAGLAVIERI